MKNHYYKKDKKALVHGHVGVSGSGHISRTYYFPRTASPLWCYSKQLSQDTIFQAKSYGADESRFFVFNQGTIVKLYDLILYRENWYQVTRVDTTDDYNTDVFVYVQDAPKGYTPTDDTLKPYGWKPDVEN